MPVMYRSRKAKAAGGIYGVTWAGGTSSAMTRTDDAAAFSDPSPAVSNGTGSSPFDNVMPWKGMEIVEDADAGTLVSIPKYYYKWTKTGAAMTLQISPKTFDGAHVSPAHADRGDGQGERKVVYVGRYHSASTYKSTTGVKPTNNEPITSFRTNIHNLGSDIWQWDFAMYWTIMMLYIVEFADWNSQNKIGQGVGNASVAALENTGLTDSMRYHTGTTKSSKFDWGHIQYRHIEDLWANIYDFVDGIYFKNANVYAINNPASFSHTTGGTLVGTRPTTNRGYCIKAWNVPSETGFEWALYPSENIYNSSFDTYVCDGVDCGYSASGKVLYAGGRYGNFSLSAGAFNYLTTSADDYGNTYGSRLMKLPNNS